MGNHARGEAYAAPDRIVKGQRPPPVVIGVGTGGHSNRNLLFYIADRHMNQRHVTRSDYTAVVNRNFSIKSRRAAQAKPGDLSRMHGMPLDLHTGYNICFRPAASHYMIIIDKFSLPR